MRHSILFFFFIYLVVGLSAQPCAARDFIVEFDHENYNEERKSFSYNPIVYHSIQVRTAAGPKLLILTGEDYHYRRWLRQYIAQGSAFVAKVPDDQTDLFISASAFEIDVTRLHPVDLKEFKEKENRRKEPSGTGSIRKLARSF